MKVGIVAPPWVPIPPKAYGGTELAIDVEARGLIQQGHDVRLFTTGDSTCPVPSEHLLEESEGLRIGTTTIELRHVWAAYEALDDVDIIHDHTVLGPLLAHELTDIPVVTTNHGPFQYDTMDLWRSVARRRVPIIAISNHQAGTADPSIPIATVIHHGIDPAMFPFSNEHDGYLACLGRMVPDKGIHTAIEVAREAGVPLLIGAKMREPVEREYFNTMVKPLLGGTIEYLGELAFNEKIELLVGAAGLLNPIAWAEPFGLVMIEALACGVPVITTPFGAAPEIVEPGRTGFVCSDRQSLLDAVADVEDLDRAACRYAVENTFSMQRTVSDHIKFFERVIERRPSSVDLRPLISW